MNLNISKILNDTLSEMESSGETEKHVKEIFRKAVFSSIDSVLNGWDMEKAIKAKMEEKLPEIVNEIGLDGYVNYVSGVAQHIVSQIENDELRQKANTTMQNLLLNKRDSIKLSEIFSAYRDEIKENVDEDDRNEHDVFNVSIKDASEECSCYKWWDVKLYYKESYDYGSKRTADFSVHYDKDKVKGYIGTLRLSGDDCDKAFGFKSLNDFEALMLNLYFNKTPVEIDVTDADDVDTNVGTEEDY